MSVSPMTMSISFMSMRSVSAAICTIAVRKPCPMSVPETIIRSFPSPSSVSLHAPSSMKIPLPMPEFLNPDATPQPRTFVPFGYFPSYSLSASLSAFSHRSIVSCMPMLLSSSSPPTEQLPGYTAFRRRSSKGSMPSFSAISSSAVSMDIAA